MRKRFVGPVALVLAVTVFGLSACASENAEEPKAKSSKPAAASTTAPGYDKWAALQLYTVQLPNSRLVDCVGSRYSSDVVAPSCDWANVRAGAIKKNKWAALRAYTVVSKDGRKVLCVGSRYSSNVVIPDCDWSVTANR